MLTKISSHIIVVFFASMISCAQTTQPQTTGKKTTTTSTSTQSSGGKQTGSSQSSSSNSSGGKQTGSNQNPTSNTSSGGKKTGSSGSSGSSSSSSQNGLTNDQIVSGLKEALSLGAQNSSVKLSAADGFFKNLPVKILMPPEAKDVESTLRSMGMGHYVDDAILSMNRAAEQAAKDAAPIFVTAIKQMSFSDATGILTGPNDAATQYLKKTTSAQLTAKFKPVIQAALQKTNATKYWNDVFSNYNKIPMVTKVNPDLTSYVTQKALDGLFYTLAQEEAKIRKDPWGTANTIIQDVFGSLFQH